ncbi:MAG: butyrate kinase [Pseudomonadota bacterium]|nr:butyrate kinase [Pseudomonadota bacterium]
MFSILVVNIGSTSTKAAMFGNRECLFKETINHAPDIITGLDGFGEWFQFHRQAVEGFLKNNRKKIKQMDLVVSRGGLTRSIQAGAYRITDAMLHDLRSGEYGWHPCNVGPAIAHEIAKRFGAEAIIYDSPVSDEMMPIARFSGLKDIKRGAAFHVLSQKSAAKRAASKMKLSYGKASFVVAHMGGGITVCAHQNGRMIDGTHGLGEGSFTPQRTGSLPLQSIIQLCFSGGYTQNELHRELFGKGGVHSYLATHDVAAIEDRVARGDPNAELVLRAMGYQISKEIGAMASVLSGRVDAVVLTGNLTRAETVMDEIRQRILLLAPLLVFHGEDELKVLAAGGAAVLRQKEIVKEY